MKKYILISILVLANCFGYLYLKNIVANQNTLEIKDSNKPIIYKKKDIILNSIDDFIFDDYFEVLLFNEYSYDYSFDNAYLTINLLVNNQNYEFKYSYNIIDPIIIEKEIIKEVYVDNNKDKNNSQSYLNNEDYFSITSDLFYFEEGTDISTIITNIADSVDTNVQVTIDYSSLNPNVIGQYPIFFITETQNYQVFVQIG